MKKKYQEAEIEVIAFQSADIITGSGDSNTEPTTEILDGDQD